MIGAFIAFLGTVAIASALFQFQVQRRKARAEAERVMFGAVRDRLADMTNRAVTLDEDPAELEPWTPAEREAFGINDTERFIRETDRELADPLERRMMADEDAIIASLTIPTPVLSQGQWVRRVEAEESFRRIAPGVWEQK